MSKRADLATLSPLREPWAFVQGCVLSPTDPAMSTSDAALGLLKWEWCRCVLAGERKRVGRVEMAMKNIRQLRKAKR